MKVVFLAAGEGARMRPLTYTKPKVMIPIANKPILEHLLIESIKAGNKDYIFVVGYCGEQIRNYFENGKKWGVNIKYYTQNGQLGTANALRITKDSVNNNFLLMNGDNMLLSCDIARISKAKDTTLGTINVKDTKDLGVVEVSDNRIVKISEKSEGLQSNMINAGIYFLKPMIFEVLSKTQKSVRGEYEITDSLQLLIDEGYSIRPQIVSYWQNVSYPWDLLEANGYLVQKTESKIIGEVEDHVMIKGQVTIGKNTIVRSGSYIVGPVMIGSNCEIGPNCYIRPITSIGDNCHIGSAVEIKNSIIMRGSKIPHQNYVGDSIIGEECNFGAGTKVANLRLDKKNIVVAGRDTKRRKLGAIIGDKVSTGINACINVGSHIGNNVFIGPGVIAHGEIMPYSKLLSINRQIVNDG